MFVFILAGSGLSGSPGVTCSSSECRQHVAVIAGSIVGGGIGLVLFIIGTWFCCRRYKGRPLQTNSIFVNTTTHTNNKQNLYDITLFKSGFWSSRYLQYGIWQGPHRFTLLFDPQTMTVTGSGSDNVGIFTIDGTFSITTARIGLTKIYQSGPNNRSENSRHQVIIQLTWNSTNRQFEGKWYMKTNRYRGENKFELKFYKQEPLLPYERV
jgi:hypothetical protein